MASSSLFFSVMDVLASSSWCPFVFALVIGIPSAVLYCLLLLVICTNFKHFSSPFFILVIIRAILSLNNYVFVFLEQRFGKIGLFLSIYLNFPRSVLAFMFFVVFYSFHVENLLTTFLLLNRLSAILMPMNYDKLWHRGLPFFIVTAFALPLPFTVPIFNLDMYIHVQRDNVTFTFDDHKMENELNSSEVAAWSAVVFVIICLFLNLTTLFVYKTKSSQMPNGNDSANERKMTIYTVATFFGQLIMAIFMVFVHLTATNFLDEQNNRFSLLQAWFGISSEKNDTLFFANFNQCPWVNDLSTVVIPAWLLLWASSKVRQIIAKKVNLRCHKIDQHQQKQQRHVMPAQMTLSVRSRPIAGVSH